MKLNEAGAEQTMETRRFTVRNETFRCRVCGARVEPLGVGCRNHCPQCLYSMHLDRLPGDRAAACGGLMEPVAIRAHSKKGYMVVHRCLACGEEAVNRLALDDRNQPDDFSTVLRLMSSSAGY